MKHLNADKLRKYKFGLLAEAEAAATAVHLEACGACRQKFQALEKQFQALEVLRDQPEVSEELISSILVEGRKVKGQKVTKSKVGRSKVEGRRTAIITQWKPALATAALLMICFAILKYAPRDPKPGDKRIEADSIRESAVAESRPVAEIATVKDEQIPRAPIADSKSRTEFKDAKKKALSKKPAPQRLLADADVKTDAYTSPAKQKDAPVVAALRAAAPHRGAATTEPEEKSLAELRAKKPFAPASNIELNVLPRRDEVQLTIYNEEDLTLVREKRKLTLKRGWNWLQFMWSNTLIDPTSLELEPKTHADKIEITQQVYPPRLNELARWTIFSEISGEADFELTYFTAGLRWNAFYEATLTPNEQAMQLTSYVRVDNGSGEDYEDAQTRLVVGKINMEEAVIDLAKQQAYYNPDREALWKYEGNLEKLQLKLPKAMFAGTPKSYEYGAELVGQDKKQIMKQGLSEYQLYTIEGRETIPNGWGKRLPSLEAQEIGVTNLYKFDEERWGAQTMRFVSFANTEEHELGETPLPKGRVRVFGKGRDGSPSRPRGVRQPTDALPLSYIGASNMKYIPLGEEVELELGAARKVKVAPKLMRTRTEQYKFDKKGNISGWDEITDWKLELVNTRSLPVELEITRATGSRYWKVSTQDEYEKYDADHLRFTVRLEPQSKQEIEYELTVYHGIRQEK